MNTLSDVAANYDELANANEATAQDLIARLNSFTEEVRAYKRWHADCLAGEAVELRARATDLRTLEQRISML